ncbi:MAG: hypothetical protein P4L74_06820, partial [Candidatus Doudnabacteria bacterium]|nr:hypothetical protein [Candidatus Doudnabacteria bacterium]
MSPSNAALAVPPATFGQGARASVSPEWPLVKAMIIAWSAFPISAAMRDFHELAARFVQQRVRFGPA